MSLPKEFAVYAKKLMDDPLEWACCWVETLCYKVGPIRSLLKQDNGHDREYNGHPLQRNLALKKIMGIDFAS